MGIWLPTGCLAEEAGGSALRTPGHPSLESVELVLPSRSDWTDYGTVLEQGAEGDWDVLIAGGFAGAAVKRKGIHLLYYQGADGYREVDGSVTGRAIGLAVSLDGVNFIKHPDNPILDWRPREGGEEGAVSSALTLDRRGRVVIYYGANTEATRTTINADARLAISANGIRFRDKGLVLDHADSTVWGYGDEIYPIITIRDSGRWYVYYIVNNAREPRRLGVAWGPRRRRLESSAPLRSASKPVRAWGMGSAVRVGPRTYALFLNDVQSRTMKVQVVSLDRPMEAGAPVRRYRFRDFRQGTVLLDEETATWFMYYRNGDQTRYGLKLAPLGEPDSTPPSAPRDLRLAAESEPGVVLEWDAATDAETGVVHYRVFRDGRALDTTGTRSFRDSEVATGGAYSYSVSAVNYHGFEGPQCPQLTVTVP